MRLCKDEIWGIRKACAQVLPQMALLVSLESRRRQLVPVMKSFIFDESEWVIITALKNLGHFIASFAQPQIYGLAYNYCLDLFITNAADEDFRTAESPNNQQVLYGNQPNSAVILHNLEMYEKSLEAILSEMDPSLVESLRSKEEKLNIEQYLMTIVTQSQLDRNSGRRSSVTSVSESDDTGISVLSESVSDYLRYERKSFSTPVPAYGEKPRNKYKDLDANDEAVARFMQHCLPLVNNFADGPMMDYSPLKLSSNDEMEVMPRRAGSLSGSNSFRRETQYNLSRGFSRSDDSFLGDIENICNTFDNRSKFDDRMSQQLPPPPLISASDNAENEASGGGNQSSNNNNDGGSNEGDDANNPFPPPPSAIGDNVNNNTGGQSDSEKQPPTKTEGDNNNDNVFEDQRLPSPPPSLLESTSDDDELAEFNSHRYWYIPPPTLDLNVINSNASTSSSTITTKKSTAASGAEKGSEETNKDDDHKTEEMKRTSSCDSTIIVTSDNDDIMDALNDTDSDTSTKQPARKKHMIGNELMEHEVEWCLIEDFIHMKDIDREMLYECAYCFPAIIFTFGARFWPLFRTHFIDLCYDCQMPVRKTMAASMSQVALIIGRANATADLVDPYVDCFSDNEVIMTEALKNMASFIKVVDPSKHERIINLLQQCLMQAKKIMWRLRETLGYQIMELIKIHDKINKVYCLPYLIGLALRLMIDRYDCVRKVGVDAFIEGFKRTNQKAEILKFFRDSFAHNICWKRRQLYILTVDKMVRKFV